MRQPLRLLFLIVLAGLAGWALLVFSRPSEPQYMGRRLSEWLEQGAASTGRPDEEWAVAVKAKGTNGLPTVGRMLRARDSTLEESLLRLINKQPLIHFRVTTASELHERGALACQVLQENAKPEIPLLLDNLSQPAGASAGIALVDIGPDGVSALAKALTNQNPDIRYDINLAYVHIESGTKTRPSELTDKENKIAVPALLERLQSDPDDTVRGQAAVCLAALHCEPDAVIPILVATLQTQTNSPYVKMSVASALARFHGDAKDAVPALLLMLKDPSPGVRHSASRALKDIDPEAARNAGVE